MSLLVGAASNGSSGYSIDNSLRFRRSATAYLQRTPSSAGNRRTYTYSCWVKKSFIAENVSPHPSQQLLFANDNASSANTNTAIQFLPTNTIRFVEQISGGSPNPEFYLTSSKLFRDASAWYHVVVAYDTTQSTDSDRIKIYINGTQLTAFDSSVYPTLNFEGNVNKTCIHNIGSDVVSGVNGTLDGYMTEINFVDGTALTPSNFGEYNYITGVWEPKKYTGTYGTNGFYLPMKPTTQATGFNTVLYTGTGAAQSIAGVGFAPDFIWLKARTGGSYSHHLVDAVRGNNKFLMSNRTDAEKTSTDQVTSFDADGFSLGVDSAGPNDREVNESTRPMVGWCWNAGGSTVTNTNGTIDSQVRANPSTGFSIATWTNESSGDDTVGHGLGVAPKLIITKLRSTSGDWYTQTTAIDGGLDYLKLNASDAAASLPKALPTADVFTTDMAGTTTAVAYSFADVAGYQKIDKYTGNGSATGPTITTGFRPAFLLIKNVNDTHGWQIYDATRNVNNPRNNMLSPNVSNAEYSDSSDYKVDFNDNGFQIVTADAWLNANSETMIYLAIAETRDEKFNFDASGNKNNWTPNNINSNASSDATYDLMSDVPTLTNSDTNNFATLNPNNAGANSDVTFGNLKIANSSSHSTIYPTNMPTTGKYYFECKMAVHAAAGGLGFRTDTNKAESAYAEEANKYFLYLNNSNAYIVSETSNVALGSNLNSGTSTFQVAIDFDAAEYYFGVNNTWYSSAWATTGNPATGANPTYNLTDGTKMFPFVHTGGLTWTVNFGQQPFTYTPPTGFKKINTFNLPDSTILDGSKYYKNKLWTGNGTNQDIDVGFNPGLMWYRNITDASGGVWTDIVRGDDLHFQTTNANVEGSFGDMEFITNGYNVAGNSNLDNENAHAFASWNWLAGGTGSSNGDGSITSTVSVSTKAGFSVVTYSGDSASSATIGHGLGIAPKAVIVKARNYAGGWPTQVDGTYGLRLNSSGANDAANGNVFFANTAPTASVFTVGGSDEVNDGYNYVAYVFAEIEGYSKIGSFIGNASANGTFVYTGFRPAFVMFKNASDTRNWGLIDTARSTYNKTLSTLEPNLTNAPNTSDNFDFYSNGFRPVSTDPGGNGSGNTIVYMAFAENPFKNSNAR
jgi:hypothetical protein